MTTCCVQLKTVRRGFSIALISACLFMSCSRPDSARVQGYVEGEFVYIASPLPGALQTLHIHRGMQVKAGDLLFALDDTPERTSRDAAERRLAQARANVDDITKGKRPSEIDAIDAQLKQARASLTLTENEFARQDNLTRTPGATSELEYLRARSNRDQARERVAQLKADLKTAQLGSRGDQIAAAEANLGALEAALTKAEWDLSQKRQTAPQAGLVFDTLYREGEWVPAGRPVVVLLPPENIKVRAFVSETHVGSIHPGDSVHVGVDGASAPFLGTVNYISPQAEYTPPVIYSKESRSKLVFMIEAVFDPASAAKLHPGQPVDIHFNF
jgi:HlyD family secretion protein